MLAGNPIHSGGFYFGKKLKEFLCSQIYIELVYVCLYLGKM